MQADRPVVPHSSWVIVGIRRWPCGPNMAFEWYGELTMTFLLVDTLVTNSPNMRYVM